MRFDGQTSFPEEYQYFGGGGGVKRLCGASGGMVCQNNVEM